MDTLLAEALQDFEEESPPASSGRQEAASSCAPAVQGSHDDGLSRTTCEGARGASSSSCDAGASAPSTAATSSRGPSLPSRGLSGSTKTGGKALAFDPLKQQASATSPSIPGQQPLVSPRPRGSSLPQLPPRTTKPKPSDPSLPPQVQKLAEDLMRLMEESGLDLEGAAAEAGSHAEIGEGPLGGLDASQFGSASLRDLVERATHAAEAQTTGSSGSTGGHSGGRGGGGGGGGGEGGPAGGVDAGPGFSSAVLRGLAEQTRSTVQQQAKVSRGEGTAAAAGGQGHKGGRGAPFGNLLGMLGGMGGSGAGAGLGGEGGSEGGMGFMVDYIMQNLLSKEVLYAPLKDIRDKYPPWLEANRATLPTEDVQRYLAQYSSIQAVCKQYEDDPSNFQRLVELIQEMQTYGDPPSAIVDEMTGGMPDDLVGASATADDDSGMPDLADLPQELKDKCPIQ